MKDNDNSFIIVLPAIAAGLLFIFLFAILKINILAALISSIMVLIIFTIILFIPSKKKDSTVNIALSNDVKSNLDLTKTYQKKLNQFIFRIENKKLVDELKIIVSDLDKMIKVVSDNPKKYKKASKYLNYYPDTTIKILEQYDKIEDNKLQGSEAISFMHKVEDLILQIRNAYEKGLNDLYSDDIQDSSVELKVLQSDLNSQIGDFKSDFNL